MEAVAKIPTPSRNIASAAEQVAEGAADENQSSQEQPIRLDHPLHTDHGCVETCLECGQSYIDNGAVDKGHAGAEDCRCEDPAPGPIRARNVSMHRSDNGFIAWRFHILSARRSFCSVRL